MLGSTRRVGRRSIARDGHARTAKEESSESKRNGGECQPTARHWRTVFRSASMRLIFARASEPRRRYRASPLAWRSVGQHMPDWELQPRDQRKTPREASGWLATRPPPSLVRVWQETPATIWAPRICISASLRHSYASQSVQRPHSLRASNDRSLLLVDVLMPFSRSAMRPSFPRAKTNPGRICLFGGLLCSGGPEANGISHHASEADQNAF